VQRTRFGDMQCSIARTYEVVGEPWSPLIIRDVFLGTSRFDGLQRNLGISRKVLTQRLAWMAERGILERRPYSKRPPRHEYVLTEKGLEFYEVLLAMAAWGDRWTAGDDGPPALFRHRSCGKLIHAEVRCSECGDRLHAADIDVVPGPGFRAATL
jgi:DNA-binding HxlR family transcriptional regulator